MLNRTYYIFFPNTSTTRFMFVAILKDTKAMPTNLKYQQKHKKVHLTQCKFGTYPNSCFDTSLFWHFYTPARVLSVNRTITPRRTFLNFPNSFFRLKRPRIPSDMFAFSKNCTSLITRSGALRSITTTSQRFSADIYKIQSSKEFDEKVKNIEGPIIVDFFAT